MSEPEDYDDECQSSREAGLRWKHDRELAMENMRESIEESKINKYENES